MSDPIRERILQALEVRAEAIVTGGRSLSASVYRARRTFTADELPAASLWDGDETATDQYGVTRQIMDVALEIHAVYGVENPSVVANRLIADGRTAMESYDAALAALIEGMTYAGAGPAYPDDGSGSVSARLRYQITYATVRGDPYTQT